MKKNSTFLKIVYLLIAVYLINVIYKVIFKPKHQEENTTVTNYSESTIQQYTAKEAIKVTALKIYNEYQNNEIRADQKYKGELVQVTGYIYSISKDFLDKPYIMMNVNEYIPAIRINFKSPKGLSDFNKGEKVTITGICSGFWAGFVMIDAQ